jgi:hypothetical protein
MSHNYTKEQPPVVSRNGVSLPLVPTIFGKTSDFKGQSFWTLEATAKNQDDFRTFIGDDIVNNVLTRFIRRVAIDLFTPSKDSENFDEHGHVIWDNIFKGFQSLDTGGATLKELNEQIGELQDEAMAITDKIEEADVYNDDDSIKADKQELYNDLTGKMSELTKKIRPLKKQIKAIQDKYAVIAAKRAASKTAVAA